MTGAYLRVERDGNWQPIEVEELTDKEREQQLTNRSPEELVRWINLLCKCIKPPSPPTPDPFEEAWRQINTANPEENDYEKARAMLVWDAAIRWKEGK